MHTPTVYIAALAVSTALTASHALADVTISSAATQNMSCAAGVCQPTATSAVLNVTDLENLLASGNVEVTTTGSGGVQALNIDIAGPVSWSNGNMLSLDANESLIFTAPVDVAATGGITLTTNDGGTNGLLSFLRKGHVDFSARVGTLVINGTNYKLEDSIRSLAYDIVGNPAGAFALAGDVDANKHLYRTPPIPIPFSGSFNGLGHVISNFEVADMADSDVGFFAVLSARGTISGVGIEKVQITGANNVGGLVGSIQGGEPSGMVTNSWVSGNVSNDSFRLAGGLIGEMQTGTVLNSWSSAYVQGGTVGGLVGEGTGGTIESSFAIGTSNGDTPGGLVGEMGGAAVTNSYSIGDVVEGSPAGGVVGLVESGTITTSYFAGRVETKGLRGGFIGENDGTTDSCYWDTSRNKKDNGVGEGSDTGITGLTNQQFRSGLPSGFDLTIWAQDRSINKGFPYLIANPPER